MILILLIYYYILKLLICQDKYEKIQLKLGYQWPHKMDLCSKKIEEKLKLKHKKCQICQH